MTLTLLLMDAYLRGRGDAGALASVPDVFSAQADPHLQALGCLFLARLLETRRADLGKRTQEEEQAVLEKEERAHLCCSRVYELQRKLNHEDLKEKRAARKEELQRLEESDPEGQLARAKKARAALEEEKTRGAHTLEAWARQRDLVLAWLSRLSERLEPPAAAAVKENLAETEFSCQADVGRPSPDPETGSTIQQTVQAEIQKRAELLAAFKAEEENQRERAAKARAQHQAALEAAGRQGRRRLRRVARAALIVAALAAVAGVIYAVGLWKAREREGITYTLRKSLIIHLPHGEVDLETVQKINGGGLKLDDLLLERVEIRGPYEFVEDENGWYLQAREEEIRKRYAGCEILFVTVGGESKPAWMRADTKPDGRFGRFNFGAGTVIQFPLLTVGYRKNGKEFEDVFDIVRHVRLKKAKPP